MDDAVVHVGTVVCVKEGLITIVGVDAAAVAQSGRVGSWGGQVFGKIASKMMVLIMLFSKVLRGGGWILTRRASTQAELSPGQRGMETDWFGLVVRLVRFQLSSSR